METAAPPPPGQPQVRAARTDDGPRIAALLPAAAGDDLDRRERATSLIPDADDVSRVVLVAEQHGEVVGFAHLVWIHALALDGPEAHVAELVAGDPQVAQALRAAVAAEAEVVGAARTVWAAAAGTSPGTVRELGPEATHLAVATLRELRPHLGAEAEVIARIDEVQRRQGYRLFAVVEPGSDDAVAVAGFRRIANLAWGDVLYVDDLVTRATSRGRGHASALLAAVDAEAARTGCVAVHLDSGLGADRADAHRRYLAHGYRISSHHFSRELAR